jgi:hypothetical protein
MEVQVSLQEVQEALLSTRPVARRTRTVSQEIL